MECLVKILLWSSLVTTWTTHAQLAKFNKKEVFFVNLEEGFFGCQVNETLEVLQIFKIEKLCDGTSDCYRGSDENQKELKCSSKYTYVSLSIVRVGHGILEHNQPRSHTWTCNFGFCLQIKSQKNSIGP